MDPFEASNSQFKVEVKKVTSQTLNAILDNEQTKTLYLLRLRKAKLLAN